MALEEFLKKSKSMAISPLVGLVLFTSTAQYNPSVIIPEKKEVVVNSKKNIAEDCLNYKLNVYFLCFKVFSCNVNYHYEKFEESGLIKEVMSVSGKHSDNYSGSISGEVIESGDTFELHSYFMRYGGKVFKENITFYNNKIEMECKGVRKIMANDQYISFQSVIKPIFTESLYTGKTFTSKTYFKGKPYKCYLVVKDKEMVEVNNSHVNAYHVVLKAKGIGFDGGNSGDFWVVEGKPRNKVVKSRFKILALTEAVMLLDSEY